MTLAGIRALNSLRVEKGFGVWGLEYSPDFTPWESGMDRLVKLEKRDFAGRSEALVSKDHPLRFAIRTFQIGTANADPRGGEPILHNEKVVGFISSAAYGHRVDKSLAIGYLYGDYAEITDGLVVEVAGENRPVKVLREPAYDPSGSKMRE